MYQQCIAFWNLLGTTEKTEWDTLARPKHMPGLAMFMSYCLKPNPGVYLPLAGGQMTGDITMAGAQTVDTVDISAHAADLAAHTRSIGEVIPVGGYLTLPSIMATDTGIALTANRHYATLLWVPRAMTFNGIYLQVTAQVGEKIRMGIYNASATTLLPSSLVLDCGEITLASTGLKSIAISKSLTKGIYFLTLVSNGTPSLLRYASLWSPLGLSAAHLGYPYGYLYRALTYDALPNPFGTATAGIRLDLAMALTVASLD